MYRSADQALTADTVDGVDLTHTVDGVDLTDLSDTVDLPIAGHDAGTVDGHPAPELDDVDTVVVHVALRPRRGSVRRCLAALAALAAAHPEVAVSVTGLGKDERAVRLTVGVELGPRAGVARFSPEAQAAYAFVSELFTSLYDHMPVYSAEPGPVERVAAAGLMADLGIGAPVTELPMGVPAPTSGAPSARMPHATMEYSLR